MHELQSIPLDRRARALSHLGTAYAILLANHGQASTLVTRKTVDMGSGPLAPELGFNFLRDRTHEESLDVAARFNQAQSFLYHAFDELGIARPPPEAVKSIGTAEAHFDSMLLDMLAASTAANTRRANSSLADRVRAAYEAVRASDPALAAAKPLESLEIDTHSQFMDGVGEAFGFAGGSMQFWSTGKWIMVILIGLGALAMFAFLAVAVVTAH
jgi:hypothetical protein